MITRHATRAQGHSSLPCTQVRLSSRPRSTASRPGSTAPCVQAAAHAPPRAASQASISFLKPFPFSSLYFYFMPQSVSAPTAPKPGHPHALRPSQPVTRSSSWGVALAMLCRATPSLPPVPRSASNSPPHSSTATRRASASAAAALASLLVRSLALHALRQPAPQRHTAHGRVAEWPPPPPPAQAALSPTRLAGA